MEKLATGLTALTLAYSALVFITLLVTGWLEAQEVSELLRPVRSLIQNFRQRKSGQPT